MTHRHITILLLLAVALSLSLCYGLRVLAGAVSPALLAVTTTVYAPIVMDESITSAPTTETSTVTTTATSTAMETATRTSTPSSPTGQNYNIAVGPGYTDVSPKQLVRTSGNRLYIVVSTCEQYPCTDVAQTLRMYRADSMGVPSGFSLADASHAPGAVSQWAIAIDGSNTIHVVWNDRTASGGDLSSLRYTTFSTSSDTWSGSVETIDTALNVALDGGGQGMQSVALALDASSAAHVVYLKGIGLNRRAYHRSRNSGGWSAATQLDEGVTYANNQKAWHPNLAFDSSGKLLVVWERGSFNGDNDGTIYGRVRAADGTWGNTVTISGDNAARVTIDQSTSLLMTPDNRYHITWIAAATDDIHYQYSDDGGQTWATNNPGSGTQASHNPSLGYAAGMLRIYAHGAPVPSPDGHGENLYAFEGSGGPAAWGGWTQLVTGTNYDSSINVRWAQYFFAFPNTIDLAYWNDGYPNLLYAGTDIR